MDVFSHAMYFLINEDTIQ